MPIYEYQCQACHKQMEALQKISDAPLRDCPNCGEPALKKKVSAASFRLKGGGWYETDFKTGNKKNLAGANESSGSGDKASTAGSGESKSGGGKSGESKSGEGKSSESKTSDSKKSESKKTA